MMKMKEHTTLSWQALPEGPIGLPEFHQWQEQVSPLLTEDPNLWHYTLARRVLASERVREGDQQARDKLARVFCDNALELWRNLGLFTPIEELSKLTETRDDQLWVDALAADLFETTGSHGKQLARALRNASRRRVKAHQKRLKSLAKLWLPWHSHRRHSQPKPSILLQFCKVLWRDVAKPELALKHSPKFRMGGVIPSDGAHYSKLPKVSGAVSWAVGRETGVEIDVEIDGECYTRAPNLARYMSWGAAILRAPHQPSERQLAIELGDEEGEVELPFAPPTLRGGPNLLGPVAGKLGLLFLTTTREDIVQGTVGELAKKLFPHKKRLLSRDFVATARAIRELDRVKIVLEDGTSVRVFDLRAPSIPEAATKNQAVYWAYSRQFLEALRYRLGPLKGEFVMNLTGAMKLEGTKPSLFRHYMFACATWNDAKNPITKRFDPNYLRVFEAKEWAAYTNTLSQSAIEYLQDGDTSKRQKLSDDLRKVRQDLDLLEAEYGLIKVEKLDQQRFKIHPPQPLLEAYEMHRRGGRRKISETS